MKQRFSKLVTQQIFVAFDQFDYRIVRHFIKKNIFFLQLYEKPINSFYKIFDLRYIIL